MVKISQDKVHRYFSYCVYQCVEKNIIWNPNVKFRPVTMPCLFLIFVLYGELDLKGKVTLNLNCRWFYFCSLIVEVIIGL